MQNCYINIFKFSSYSEIFSKHLNLNGNEEYRKRVFTVANTLGLNDLLPKTLYFLKQLYFSEKSDYETIEHIRKVIRLDPHFVFSETRYTDVGN